MHESRVEAGKYVYHRVPSDMRGTMLYPSSTLERCYPEIAAVRRTKYVGREAKPSQPISLLNCRWRDVINLTPVHPADVRAAMAEAGHLRFPRHWFEIGVAVLTPEDTVLYLTGSSPAEARFVPYTPGCLAHYAEVSDVQRRFYREVEPGQSVLLFGGTPHVLHRGNIDVGATRIIEV